jgi:uncharacterized protein YbbC (DUF1343 family)
MQQVIYGVDRFIEQAAKYKQLKFGLITNNAATTSTSEASRLALLKKGINVVRLFSPEHGLSAKGEDGGFQKILSTSQQVFPLSVFMAKN